ncbi:hypothetical protein BDV95DRAFT_591074 [Massariosphaeria phaeospora]|uniref:F-box domain-containing protein n=1 Tax=Massariosphaeria phaeospora TaxID=100035 RepID=A0A7C8MKG8_9PLEO|nr:hypothetical protein BDV95DRAFT_591074 [Massariosphaeria phaeospora]
MASHLERLPLELLDLITSYLPALEYCHLRLVSKQLHTNSLRAFIKRYFATIRTTLCWPSICHLAELSTIECYAKEIKLLDVRIHNWSDRKTMTIARRRGPEKVGCSDANKFNGSYQDLVEESQAPEDVDAVETLAQALKGFPNLHAIRIYTHAQYLGLLRCAKRSHYSTECFMLLLDALVESKTKLQELSMLDGKDMTSSTYSSMGKYQAFCLPSPRLPIMHETFVNLRSLSLCIDTTNVSITNAVWENGICKFIYAATSLESLSLELDGYRIESPHSSSIISSMAAEGRLARLQRFELASSMVDGPSLQRFLQQHLRTLRCLALVSVNADDSTWPTTLAFIRDTLEIEQLYITTIHFFRPEIRIDSAGRVESPLIKEVLTSAIDQYKKDLKLLGP